MHYLHSIHFGNAKGFRMFGLQASMFFLITISCKQETDLKCVKEFCRFILDVNFKLKSKNTLKNKIMIKSLRASHIVYTPF